ncbi:lanthionine synthetase LanC family protein [Mucilaginibacter sp. KACC 22063]|uniref:lanthionine synthetase LanC family protein n=1 Tax=Mucilaginibacter sp. KACC 22063 TaxID=3025666 RepID=UPI002365CFCB|nr:lanthionine synthetase LanC family protein [Mucilaginibacter sp. KACC 22063]WDF56034.1 hypothetical protein PQ461_03035 [Mucilaginibacter sp. KACC 22063]
MSKVELNSETALLVTGADIDKLHEIASYLEDHITALPLSPGVTNGKCGAALFFYNYATWVNEDPKYINLCESILLGAIKDLYAHKINGALYYNDIAELGMFITHLQNEGFLDHSFDEVLRQIDLKAINGANKLCAEQNFDRFTGFLTLAYYFLQRNSSAYTEVREAIQHIIDTLLSSAQHTGSGSTYWVSKLFNKSNIYLGWSHGVASVILLLTEIVDSNSDYRITEIKDCINAACQYLIDHKNEKSDSCFPDIVGEEKANSPLNLCYGDLGIGYALLKAGKSLNNELLYEQGLNSLRHSALRRSLSTCNIHDASVIYGTSGLITLFSNLYQEYQLEDFAIAADYWYSVMQVQLQQPGKPAGYSGYYNQGNPHVNFTLYEGLSGLGLSLMALQAGTKDLIKFIGY